MKLCALAFCLLLTASSLRAEDGLVLKPDQAFYQKDGLFLRVVLVEDPKLFLNEWMKPSQAETPVVKTRNVFRRGDVVMPAIMYNTNGLRTDGTADISYTFEFRRPDGSLYEEILDKTVVNGIPPRGIGLFQDMSGLQIEENDPLGEYSIKVKITDHVKKDTVEIPFTFEVSDEAPAAVSLLTPERQAPAANPRIDAPDAATNSPTKPSRVRSFTETNQ